MNNAVLKEYCDDFVNFFGNFHEKVFLAYTLDSPEVFKLKSFLKRYKELFRSFEPTFPFLAYFEDENAKGAEKRSDVMINILFIYGISLMVYLKCCRILNKKPDAAALQVVVY